MTLPKYECRAGIEKQNPTSKCIHQLGKPEARILTVSEKNTLLLVVVCVVVVGRPKKIIYNNTPFHYLLLLCLSPPLRSHHYQANTNYKM